MHIYIPIIAYNQNINGNFMLSLIELILLLKSKNYDISLDPIFFESLITRGRNATASRFLNNKSATHLIFIDTDIAFNPNDVLKLIEADKPVIGAAYPKKYYKFNDPNYPVDFTINGVINQTNEEFIFKAELLPTGFLCIKREVLLKIVADNPEIQYINNIDGYVTETNVFYNFFQCLIDNDTHHYLSEDYSFSKICTKSGIDLFVYSDITLRHIGFFNYEGNLNEFLKKMKK